MVRSSTDLGSVERGDIVGDRLNRLELEEPVVDSKARVEPGDLGLRVREREEEEGKAETSQDSEEVLSEGVTGVP